MLKYFAHKRCYSSLAVAVLLSFFPLKAIFALDGRIQGRVLDKSGNPLEKVKISLFDSSRGLKFSTKTDKNGKFFKRGIFPSTYEITFELEEYVTEKETVNIRPDWTAEMNVRMQKAKVDTRNDFEMGSKLFKEGNYEEAIKYFKKIIDISPNMAMAYYNLGLSYLRTGNIEEALSSLKRALELKPDMVITYFALGECYVQKEMFDEAIGSFKNATAIEPDNPRIYFNIGLIYSRNNQIDEALAAFKEAEKLDPNFSSNQYQLGLLYLRKGDFEKATSCFEKFLELEPNAPEASQVRKIIDELKIKNRQ
ncbi:MAG TPA: tetratricopeptide repeat protein [Desulfatiglandales bacterium]|nr:tetratricopeptide repeat protein [Desulfatiglandales bacterium]